MDWYYVDQGQQIGPVTEAQFEILRQNGKVTADTLVWHSGMPEWQRYEMAIQEAAPPHAHLPAMNGATTATCTECGGTFAASEMLRYGSSWVCAACKRIFFQKLKEGVQPAGILHYAGFWLRVGAKMIDGLLVSLFNILVNVALGAWLGSLEEVTEATLSVYLIIQQGLSWAAMITYSTYFVGKFGATPGKMACHLHIVTPTGAPISYGKAFGRFWAELLSGLLFGIGYLMVAWDSEKRALHDRLCHTRVVRRN